MLLVYLDFFKFCPRKKQRGKDIVSGRGILKDFMSAEDVADEGGVLSDEKSLNFFF